MTLLEIIFSVTLILIMTMATSSVIRSGIDTRIELSQRSKVNHRLMAAMQRISEDLQLAFILDSQRQELNYVDRATKSIFQISAASGGSSELKMTTMSHEPLTAKAAESDQTFVVYRVEKENLTGMSSLYRGNYRAIPQNFDEEIPMQILARNIKSLKVTAWTGDAWREEWNSNKSDWRNMMPRMVQVEIEAYTDDPEEGRALEDNSPTAFLRTIVFLPRAVQTREPREPAKSIRYY